MAAKKNTPLISVVIPTYNRAALAVKTIQSVINQTYTNWECIIVDDGSTNQTKVALARLASSDSRIQLIELARKGNANIARNVGMRSAKGEFIAMLDSDDVWLNHHLETRLHSIGNYEGSYSGHIDVFDTQQIEASSRQMQPTEDPFTFIVFSSAYATTTSLFLRAEAALTILWDEQLLRHQDYDFNIRFMRQYTTVCDPNLTVLINRRDNRVSSFNFKGCLQFYRKYEADFSHYPPQTQAYLLQMSKRAYLQKEYAFAEQYWQLSQQYGTAASKSLKDWLYFNYGQYLIKYRTAFSS